VSWVFFNGLVFDLWHDKLRQCDSRDCPVVLKGLADFREHLGGELTLRSSQKSAAAWSARDGRQKLSGNCIDWLKQAGVTAIKLNQLSGNVHLTYCTKFMPAKASRIFGQS